MSKQPTNKVPCPICGELYIDTPEGVPFPDMYYHIWHSHIHDGKCFCGEDIEFWSGTMTDHIRNKHNRNLKWMYAAYHAQILGVTP